MFLVSDPGYLVKALQEEMLREAAAARRVRSARRRRVPEIENRLSLPLVNEILEPVAHRKAS